MSGLAPAMALTMAVATIGLRFYALYQRVIFLATRLSRLTLYACMGIPIIPSIIR